MFSKKSSSAQRQPTGQRLFAAVPGASERGVRPKRLRAHTPGLTQADTTAGLTQLVGRGLVDEKRGRRGSRYRRSAVGDQILGKSPEQRWQR